MTKLSAGIRSLQDVIKIHGLLVLRATSTDYGHLRSACPKLGAAGGPLYPLDYNNAVYGSVECVSVASLEDVDPQWTRVLNGLRNFMCVGPLEGQLYVLEGCIAGPRAYTWHDTNGVSVAIVA